MLFTVGKSNLHDYRYRYPITNGWILYSDFAFDGNYVLIGYKLGQHGGDFLEIKKDTDSMLIIKSSFFKDFDFYSEPNNQILLSNDPRIVPSRYLSRDILQWQIGQTVEIKKRFSWTSFFQVDRAATDTVKLVKQKLSENLNKCITISLQRPKMVFTGGLDSGTLVALAHRRSIDFDCVINDNHKNFWENLPFGNIQYAKSGLKSCAVGKFTDIKESFYDQSFDRLITGFYGDSVMLHNATLWYQSLNLFPGMSSLDIYDVSLQKSVPMFRSDSDVKISIIKILMSVRFRHWFEDFLTLDPYRDIELARLVCGLPMQDLVEQFGQAWVQRQIIFDELPELSPLILKYKNVYSNIN